MLPVPCLSGLRARLGALSLLPVGLLGALGALSFQPDAVATKFVQKIGVSGVDFKLDHLISIVLKPAGGAGQSAIRNLIIAIVALVLLGALVYFLFGILSTMGGHRGGIEKVGAVVFALVVGIAVLEIIS